MNKRTILFILAAVFLTTFCFSQTAKVDAWEQKINKERQPPEKVMDAIGLKAGMTIGEIGCGRGRYTVHLAKRVGNNGKVYASDIDNKALDYLRERCKLNNIKNIKIILGKEDDALLPENKLDMAVMVWVYHMIPNPVPLLKNLKKSLKPGATLVILDPPDSEINTEMKEMGIKMDPKYPTIKSRIEHGAKQAGFKMVKVLTFLPKDGIYILKIK